MQRNFNIKTQSFYYERFLLCSFLFPFAKFHPHFTTIRPPTLPSFRPFRSFVYSFVLIINRNVISVPDA